MLKRLYIKNFTLIDELDINFYQGFSVITGETGAGKSIILGAIGLLLGQRADAKSIKPGADRCVIEAHFNLSRYGMESFFSKNDIDYDPEDCIVRRELTAVGKSRGFINDIPAAVSVLKELGERLIDIHSQHQNLLLNKEDFQLNVVDIIAGNQNELATYQKSYVLYKSMVIQLQTLKDDIQKNRDNQDFLKYQYDELKNANLKDGEQEELEQKSETMSHAEDIKSALYEADIALSSDESGIVSMLHNAQSSLSSIAHVYPDVTELVERLGSTYIELKDISQDVSSMLEKIDFDPSELDFINSRLDRLYELEKKYHVETVNELISKRDELKAQLNNIENSDEAVAELEKRLSLIKQQTREHADKLTQLRIKSARQIEKEMQARLIPLGMPNVRFSISITEEPLGRNGKDKIAFLFSANTSTPLQPVSQIASGGEIARVMLALKAMISGAVKLPTIIFDEIDTGVSGKIAEKMAEIMKEMGLHDRQVISITHLPQIAALGNAHYKVEKKETDKGTVSYMKELNQDERIKEIAQMLSGSDISNAAIENAKQLLRL